MVIEALCVVVNLAMAAPQVLEAGVRGVLQAHGVKPKQEQVWQTVTCPSERKEDGGAEDRTERKEDGGAGDRTERKEDGGAGDRTKMLAMLGGAPIAEGLFGVSMGDPIKPDEGWSPGGYGSESREYKGALGFDYVTVIGTRKGGTCAVVAWQASPDHLSIFDRYNLWLVSLSEKYGKSSPIKDIIGTTENEWGPFGDRRDRILRVHLGLSYLDADTVVTLGYSFENYWQCEKAQESILLAYPLQRERRP